MGKKRYLVDEVQDGRYVRAWKEGRGRNQEVVVQIWNSGKPEGDPDGEWGMPGILGVPACVSQALKQTPKTPEGEPSK